ncbi:MAG TPA: LysR family transcriptional regulator [Methylomusa anaerophila]|uniref:HTH-type transcriptional regulator CynR n=1 Tax=Methylomusa anaerophila TaxID=1930071 RepID=A0A348AN47_9FIRM|nr:LysR family transcriptional regulator [Methylomusa anaerophila]BBB92495.1 HTH-type transcriptional regulator CynR [Methylomusa anaerophila]HML87653.1 LysR family transcriptional regulator [Methylomusa anaerophila]
MELKQLKYFIAVCEELHFTRAAEKLGIAQSTLSLQIGALEEEIGLPLFDRIGKKIKLTETGTILLENSQKVFWTLQNAQNKISELREFQGGSLAVGVLHAELDYRLNSLFIDFHNCFPQIHLKILSSVTIDKQILNNEADVGISLLPKLEKQLVCIPLYSEEYVLVVSKNHELANTRSISIMDIEKINMVMYPRGFVSRELVEECCRHNGFHLNTIIETTAGSSIFGFVKANIGATIQPLPLIQSINDPTLHLIKVKDWPITRNIGIFYRSDKYLGFATREFIKFVKKRLEIGDIFFDILDSTSK